jgi:hypothetical protein
VAALDKPYGGGMQKHKAEQLRIRWAEQGSPPCDHPELDREYDLGGDTSDKVCTTCGEVFWPEKLREMGR